MRGLRLFAAVVLGPIPLVLFMLATSVGLLPVRPAYWAAAVVLAQALFWITYFVARQITARLKVRRPRTSMVLVFGGVFLVLSSCCSFTAQAVQGDFQLMLLLRDSIAISLAGVASYIFHYALVRGASPKVEPVGA
jgi:hypothetical protein